MIERFHRQLFWRGALSGVICALLAWLTVQAPVFQGLEEWMLDGCFFFRGERPTESRVILIGLDDVSLDKLGKPLVHTSPELAKVLTHLDSLGAAAIGLDMIIPASMSGLPGLARDAPGDATTLGEAIMDADKVVLAKWLVEERWLEPLHQWRLKSFTDSAPTDLAFVNLTEDDDNFLRRQRLFIRDQDQVHLHFALALFALANPKSVQWGDESLCIAKKHVPLDDEMKLRVNYVGPPGTFDKFTFRDALDAASSGAPLPVDVRDAIVIIGVTARSQQDWHATPFANNYWRNWFQNSPGLMSGSELHANIIATLSDRAYIVPMGWLSSLGMLVVFGLILGIGLDQLNRVASVGKFFLYSLSVIVVHHFAWKFVCVEAFRYLNLRIEMLGMLVLGVYAWGGNFAVRWLTARRVLRVLTGPFGGIVETERRLEQNGEERIVTVLFSDVRDFTTYSESHSPRQVVALLNTYFSAIVPIIERNGGTLNQYIGDGIMVLYGAPHAREDHAARAVRTAVEMVRCVHEMQEVWTQCGNSDFRIGVGIHTGPAIIGCVGSRRRSIFTAIGDTVNAAARIEGQNKHFGTEILVSRDTYQSIPLSERKELGCQDVSQPVQMKGKQQAIDLYEVKNPS